ncbi:MAG: carboxypeptidase regulatory-like domain-containing protein [Candidatus Cloacimonetes bacterium]|jgi:hypothetical protein|nr:carboxypeptidase regulatory-like domain-containing protein [Candidatus Cloacimonadota bacterium]MDY0171550.1 carboxypeptidase regulatory-like domain-containing protein [Candidatus Cloacimonadaceae bacterium]
MKRTIFLILLLALALGASTILEAQTNGNGAVMNLSTDASNPHSTGLTRTDPPFPATLRFPLNGQTRVSPFTQLAWTTGGGQLGYKLNLGTNNPPSNIENNLILQNVIEYTPSTRLNFDTTYFWQIIPYNETGDATNCPIWSFSTREYNVIEALPYAQNWDAVTVPALPADWGKIVISTHPAAMVVTSTIAPFHSTPNNVRMSNFNDFTGQILLVSPEFAPTIPMNNIRIKAWLRSSSINGTVDIGVMTNPIDPSTFELIATMDFANTAFSERIIALNNYTGDGHFIAFRHGMDVNSLNIFVDDVMFEEISSDDLAAIAIHGNATPSVGALTHFTIDVFNNGTVPHDIYTVRLMDSMGTELASVAGPMIAAAETLSVSIPWTPTQEGVMSVHGKVVLPGDVNALNDNTPELSLLVQPEGITAITIGVGDQNARIPWEFYFKNSLFQSLYYQDEMDMFGTITSMKFYSNFAIAVMDTPIKIWLGSTTEEDLSGGWIDPISLTLVYDGNMDFFAGQHTITIPLQTPYTYAGGNLVLYANRPMDTQWHSTTNYFRSQTVGNNRARLLESNSMVFNPMAPQAAGTLSGTFPRATFYMDPLSDVPIFAVSPPEFDFGTVLIPNDAEQNFTITNVGGGSLGISSISLTGDPAFTLTALPDLPASLTTGQNLIFGLSYNPLAEGLHTAQILITDNITREVHIIDITGEGHDATIYSLPFSEDWDLVSVPFFPLGWSQIRNSTDPLSYLRTSINTPHSLPNCVQISNAGDASAELILISPIIDAAIDLSDIRVKIMLRGGINREMQIGTIVDPTDANTFELAETLTITANWAEYTVHLSAHTGLGRYIAIKHGVAGLGQIMYIDDVIFEEISQNDLAAISIEGNVTPTVNIASNYTVSVLNNGTAAQSDYLVQIVDGGGTILATQVGGTIAPNETVNVILTYTPVSEGSQVMMGKVVLAGDVNSVNDTSIPLYILVQPEEVISFTIGGGDIVQHVPWEFQYKNSLFQTLYYPNEFAMFGRISGINFYNNFSTDIPNSPIKLWLGTTNRADLADGWIDPATLTLVFDGVISFPSGANTITIPLIEPFHYFRDNLVLYAFRPMDTQTYSPNEGFLAQIVGSSRARKVQDNFNVYNPMNPSATGTLSGTFPKTTFLMTANGMGKLSGTVTASGAPLAGVLIRIANTNHQSITSTSGEYSLPYLLAGNHTLSVHKVGYADQAINFSIIEGQTTTLDIIMQEYITVSVSGTIVGSDHPTVGLSGAVINLYGALNYSANTNAVGQFGIQEVLSGNSYDYTIRKAGYQTASGTIEVGTVDYHFGTFILDELSSQPSDVVATLNDAETAVVLTWDSPDTPVNGYFFDFEYNDGDWEPGSDWANPAGDWEYTDSYNVAQWNPSYAGSYVMPPNAATSGTGMWGTSINTNYTNSNGFSYLSKTLDLSGFGNTQMSFWSWENISGPRDYAQISVNGTLVWGPSWDYIDTAWQERIIDLSAYDGMHNVEVRFEMFTNATVNYAGWYIDDVFIGPADQLVLTSPPLVMPTVFRGQADSQATHFEEERASQISTRDLAESIVQSTQNPSRLLMGYKVWRLRSGQEYAPDLWTLLTPATITETTFTDTAWASFPDGFYRWALRTVYTNGVYSNVSFSNIIRKEPNDMAALSIHGNVTPTVGVPSAYTITIKNSGTSAQAAGAYTVKLMSGATELISVAGPAIAVNQIIDFVVDWNPIQEGPITIHGKVVIQGDTNPTNDETDGINLLVMPAGQFTYTVGDGNELANVPVNMLFKSSLFQMIIYPAELGNFAGLINGIQFYNNFTADLANKHTKIWLETTTRENLSAGWVAISDNSTLVFDANVHYPFGENTVSISFAEPFLYMNGENLLITVQRPLDTANHSSQDRFKCQTIGTNRARETKSNSLEYDPTSPLIEGTLTGQFPMTTFLGVPDGVANLSGTVTTGANSDPLEGVLVEIEAAGYATATDAAGAYEIPNILPYVYEVQFSKYGYISQAHALDLEENEQAVINVNMQPLPTVSVSGSILASDTGSALAGAMVELIGYADYYESTNDNGEFNFAEVYADESYEYTISAPGYASVSGTINVSSTAYHMGNIVLNEIAFAPHSVVVALNSSNTSALLQWGAPDPNVLEILESFENSLFPPQDWSQIITNAGPQNTSGVYPTFKRLGAVEIPDETNAIPTHGNFQTGLWWTYEHQDEWLVTPTFDCPPDGYLRFDSYVFLGSVHEDHYYVKISLDDGNSWQILWDASAETGGQNTYGAPFVVDLTSYSGQQITLAFQAEDPPSNDGLWYSWFIDNIYIGNTITTVSFDGPARALHSPLLTSNMPASEALTRDGVAQRINTAKTAPKSKGNRNRALVGYEIYRFISGQEGNAASWNLLNADLQSALTFEDTAWETLPNGSYRWGVKAIYTAGVSSPAALSNPLIKDTATGNLIGFVRKISGQGIAGATVTAGSHQTATNTAGAYFMALPVGSHTVSVSAVGYETFTVENVVISADQNTTLNISLEPVAAEDELSPVTATALKGNSPNPFNPTTTIYYDILEPCSVQVDVYNVKGQKVHSLLNEVKNSGRHSIAFEARDDSGRALSSGVYFYRFTAGKYRATRKMLLME